MKTKLVPTVIVSLCWLFPTFPTRSMASEEVPIARIIEVTGKVKLLRRDWTEYQETTIGADLYRGDLLQPAQGAIATIRCTADNLIERLPDGVPSGVANFCAKAKPLEGDRAIYRGDWQRGNADIPYIITPRATLILNDRPLLRWNAIDTESYQVKVIGDGVNWEVQVQENQVRYSGELPLQPGGNYQVIVYANNEASSLDEEVQGFGFKLVDERTGQRLQHQIAQLQQQSLSETGKALAIAHLYSSEGLFAEAIATLETLANNETQTAAVYRLLGELYWQIGLPLLAEQSYKRAIELAVSPKDAEDKAAAQTGLGEIYRVLQLGTSHVRH